jgi:hypothetical protein
MTSPPNYSELVRVYNIKLFFRGLLNFLVALACEAAGLELQISRIGRTYNINLHVYACVRAACFVCRRAADRNRRPGNLTSSRHDFPHISLPEWTVTTSSSVFASYWHKHRVKIVWLYTEPHESRNSKGLLCFVFEGRSSVSVGADRTSKCSIRIPFCIL